MGLDLAPSSVVYLFVSMLSVLYLVIPLFVLKKQGKNWKEELKTRVTPKSLSWQYRTGQIGVGVALGYGLLYLSSAVLTQIRRVVISIFGDEFYQTAAAGSVSATPPSMTLVELILIIIVNFLFIAFCEEFFYRGVLLKEWQQKSPALGILASSLLFALYHVFPGIVPFATLTTYFPYYFIFGLILAGVTYFQNGDLLVAIVAHGSFNSFIFLLRFL